MVLAGVLAAGVASGPLPGGAAGLAMGVARMVSSVLDAPPPDPVGPQVAGLQPDWVLSLVTSTVLYVLAGGVAGYAARLLRRAEVEIAPARARQEVARTLHYGVLQTLALVERRTEDPDLADLADLAREQERDLRRFLYGDPATGLVGAGDLGDALRAAAGRFEAHHRGRVQVLVPDDLPEVPRPIVGAVAGAVGAALTNAGKHGGADRVVVYVEPQAGGLFCSVKDDGTGFDPATVAPGAGLTSSVRGRIAEVGGTVEVDSAPGRGTEVRLTVPTP